jgi:hypothetical protein
MAADVSAVYTMTLSFLYPSNHGGPQLGAGMVTGLTALAATGPQRARARKGSVTVVAAQQYAPNRRCTFCEYTTVQGSSAQPAGRLAGNSPTCSRG